MARRCDICGGPLCPLCWGCIEQSECDCYEPDPEPEPPEPERPDPRACPACHGSGEVEVGHEWFSWESGCREDDFETVPCWCEAGQRLRLGREKEVSDDDTDEVRGEDRQLEMRGLPPTAE